MMRMSGLASLFKPASVLLLGYSGPAEGSGIYAKEFEALRRNLEGRATVLDLAGDLKRMKIPKKVDLAVLSLPERLMGRAVKVLLSRRVRHLLITCELSERTEREVKALAGRREVTIIGPNSAPGIVCPESGIAATAFSGPLPRRGFVSVICQNRAFGDLILKSSSKRGLGISKFICTGRSEPELRLEMINHISADDRTYVICLEFSDLNRAMLDALKKITAAKPVVAMYTGPDDPILLSALKQVGVIPCGGAERLLAVGYAVYFAPPMPGNRVVLVTNAPETAGPAKMALKNLGLALARPSEETRNRLTKWSSVAEDGVVTIPTEAGEDVYKNAVRCLMQDGEADAVLMILAPDRLPVTAERLTGLIGKNEKPVIGAIIGSEGLVLPESPKGTILLATIEEAVEAMRGCLISTKNRARIEGSP